MELAFLTPLLKDGTNCVSGGVTINHEGVLETWLSEDWCCTDGIYQGLKGGFMFRVPVETASFGTMCDKGVEWCGKHTEIANIHAIKVKETKEGLEFAKCHGSFPIFNTIDFDWVHSDAIFANDNTKVFNFCGFKLTFLWFEVEVVVGEYLEDIINDATM